MFVVKISGNDSSCHTNECDALDQKARLIANGTAEDQITLVEQDSFNPPR